jgi:hypothetical protein
MSRYSYLIYLGMHLHGCITHVFLWSMKPYSLKAVVTLGSSQKFRILTSIEIALCATLVSSGLRVAVSDLVRPRVRSFYRRVAPRHLIAILACHVSLARGAEDLDTSEVSPEPTFLPKFGQALVDSIFVTMP